MTHHPTAMNDRTVTYNNAGVYLMMQHNHDAAMDLFLGARACLRQQTAAAVIDPAIVRAELLLADLNSHQTHDEYQQHRMSEQQHTTNHSAPNITPHQQQPLYLVRNPLAIPPDILSSPHCIALCHTVILFNLGLTVQHGSDPTSDRVAQLYHTASAVLSDIPDSHATLVLAIAILNNTGVWCQRTGDTTSAASCMEQLNVLLQEEAHEQVLQPELLQGITANVVMILLLNNTDGTQGNDDAQDGLHSSVVSPAA